MSYRFRPKEPIPKGVRRIGREQINTALRALSEGDNLHQGVHKARKRIKCLRSLLRLIRPGLEKTVYRHENRSYRDIAHGLSGARDAQAMLETLAKLEARSETYLEKTSTTSIRTWLYDRHREAELSLDKATMAGVLDRLHTRKKRFSNIPLKQIDFLIVGEGVKTTYKRGRAGFLRAVATRDGGHFHEWRKDAQQHWRQMQLVRPCWPQMMDMRARYAHELSQLLGDDHDLEVFGEMVQEHSSLFEDKVDLEVLLRQKNASQTELRRSAIMHGRLLYAEKPRHFQQRIVTCWEASVCASHK